MKKNIQKILGEFGGLIFLGSLLGMAWCSSLYAATETEKGGAQLWSENCARCHNMRSPSTYNDTGWDIVAAHMRVRANLTAEEHKKILKFLKSGS